MYRLTANIFGSPSLRGNISVGAREVRRGGEGLDGRPRRPCPSQDVDPYMLEIRCYIGGGERIQTRSCGERERKILQDMRHAPFLDREPAGTKIHPLMVATRHRLKTKKGRATEQRSYITTKIMRSHLQRRCHLPPVTGTFDVLSILKSTIIYVICHGLTAVFILRHMCMNHSLYTVYIVRQTCSMSLLRGHATRMYIVNGIKQTAGKGSKDSIGFQ